MDPAPASVRPRFAGAVLAGGASTRMGRPKALLEIEGVPMATRVAGALRVAGATEVSLVGGPAEWGDRLDLPWVADLAPGEGPLAGLVTALACLDDGLLAVCACDLAWLDAATLVALVESVGDHDAALARTDRLEPLCGVWRPARCRRVLGAAFDRGERAIHRALSGLDVLEVPVARQPLTNVNTPDDVAGGGPDRPSD